MVTGFCHPPGIAAASGTLPFDLATYDVTPYVNDPNGLEALKVTLKAKITARRGSRIPGPVNEALDAVLKRSRTASYFFWGAALGPVIAVLVSLISATLSANFQSAWPGGFVRTLLEGATAWFFGCGLVLAAYSVVVHLREFKPDRLSVVVAQLFAGVGYGLIVAVIIFFLKLDQYGWQVALGTSLPYLLMFTGGGIAMGFSLNIQPPLERIEPFGIHFRNAALWFTFVVGAFVLWVTTFKERLFFASYLERYRLIDGISDGIRFALWGVGIACLQWWLKARKRE